MFGINKNKEKQLIFWQRKIKIDNRKWKALFMASYFYLACKFAKNASLNQTSTWSDALSSPNLDRYCNTVVFKGSRKVQLQSIKSWLNIICFLRTRALICKRSGSRVSVEELWKIPRNSCFVFFQNLLLFLFSSRPRFSLMSQNKVSFLVSVDKCETSFSKRPLSTTHETWRQLLWLARYPKACKIL